MSWSWLLTPVKNYKEMSGIKIDIKKAGTVPAN
jgi:hypothetical protein